MSRADFYLDLGSGVAGDMLIGALVGLGLRIGELNAVLHKVIPVKGWNVRVQKTEREGWPAYAVTVDGDRPFGDFNKMNALVRRAQLPSVVKTRAGEILESLQSAEAQAHGSRKTTWDRTGLGLLDTLVDVLGTSWGFWRLGIDQVNASPLCVARLAPAASAMLSKSMVPCIQTGSPFEIATPTGVAILLAIAKSYGGAPLSQIARAGYGAGKREIPGKPNVLALFRGVKHPEPWNQDEIVVLETAIDDMDPRLYPHAADQLFKAGALDVWWTPIGMKKGRPGISFTVLCAQATESAMLKILFRETTTLGVRRHLTRRWTLPRQSNGLYKIAILPHGQTKKQVEYEKARKRAERLSKPLKALLRP